MSLDGRSRWKAAALLASAVLLAATVGFILSRPNALKPSPPSGAVSPPVITSVPPSAGSTIPLHDTCAAACPMSGFGYALAYHPPARRVLLFGGIDNYANTWLWNYRGWTLAHPSASPPGRFDAAVAYDPIMHVLMLYGGRLAPGQVVDDTWAWDGKTWRELATNARGRSMRSSPSSWRRVSP